MNKKSHIACCGLDCDKCDAHIATVNNDNALREKTAKLWAALNNAPITAEMINCDGCRADGIKTPFCDSMCEIRQCVLKKGYATCADCPDSDGCAVLGAITNASEEARSNLKAL